ncbi:DNA-binding protein [Proteus vulgaris]|uniref:YobI family P-loop NTPase n=1 Tax=Proteus vulgaris TaxID=585 RepID=UPI001FFF65B5|nr:DNA-binding protein [Proteus vulgaris]UPK80658.1 DNA-binding protein [Proteus vulgaris]
MTFWEKIKKRFPAKKNDISDDEQQGDYNTLTPKIITDDTVKPYFEALDFAFSKKDVKNIAITGPYGAGKSTVILSYLKFRDKQNFINVSLADFSISGKNDPEPPENTEIELSILQQILYKENKDNLPDSRLDRIQNRNKKHIFSLFFNTTSIIIPLIILSISLFPKKTLAWFNINEVIINSIINAYPERLVISLLIGLVFIFCVVRSASKAGIFDKKIKLSKIAFLQGSVDLTSNEQPSLLNNCLDEIVYFFSRSKYKIVIFEDLDRLGNTEVFIKLREINQIINNNISTNPVRFIYACRDDIFLGADIKTKFFDFILPIIPIMDSSNAYTLLKNKLNDFPENKQLVLKRMSAYINDMRSLQNIVNEFNLFKNVVNNTKDQEKIFALIFYKNIYAQDYNLVDKRHGVLYSLIQDYRLYKLHKDHFGLLDRKLEELNEHLIAIKNESATSDMEIRKQIISKFISPELWSLIHFAKRNKHYSQDYDEYSAEKFYKEEQDFIDFFNCNEPLFIGYEYHSGYGRDNNFVKIETSSVIDDYYLRIEVIKNDKLEEYRKTVEEIKVTKEKIKTRNSITLAKLLELIGFEQFEIIAESYIEKCNIPEIIDPEQLKALKSGFNFGGFEALYHLLTNGYIMQDYMMFRSIFHQGSISINDNDYIQEVGRYINFKEINENYFLDNSEDVLVELIEHNYFYRSGALHYQIITLLLESKDYKKRALLSSMIDIIFTYSSKDILEIYSILEDKFTDYKNFINFIIFSLKENSYLDKMITVIEDHEQNHTSISIATKMIALVSPDISENEEKYHKFIINQGFNLISNVEEEHLQLFLDNIKKLKVIYNDISIPITPNETIALEFIAKNNLYNLDKSSYRIIVAGLLQDKNISCEQVDEHPWSLINDEELTDVKSYVNDNINTFVSEIFIHSKENSESIVSILTHPDLDNSLKVKILEEMQFTIDNLRKFPKKIDTENSDNIYSYHDLFFHHNHVTPSWKVLLDYIYEDCNLDVLTQYIEEHAQILSYDEIDLIEGDNYDLLYMKVICNDNISDNAYNLVLKPVYINTHSWDEQLSLANFLRLIVNNKVPLNNESYKNAIQCFSPNESKENIESFILWLSKFKEVLFSDENYYLFYEQDNELLESMLIAINDSNLFSNSEKASLLYKYREECHESFIDELDITNEILISLIKLSNNDNFSINLIVRLINNNYKDREEIANLVDKLQEKEFNKIFNQKTATLNFNNNQDAELLFSTLEKEKLIKKWISRNEGKYYIECIYEEK